MQPPCHGPLLPPADLALAEAALASALALAAAAAASASVSATAISPPPSPRHPRRTAVPPGPPHRTVLGLP